MHFRTLGILWPPRQFGLHLGLKLLACLLLLHGGNFCKAMPQKHVLFLREQAHAMLHHGFDSYMDYAWPADEIRPLNCEPLNRNTDSRDNMGINDILGNYSLTAIDSLSALAMMSHASDHSLKKFWETVQMVSEMYWPYGFDRDAKVQVFETVIRGVGGLLSAHQFAMGLLPMGGKPRTGIKGWKYNDELLFLAHDLATRLLPAFDKAPTDIPFPRVNLRHGCVNKPFKKPNFEPGNMDFQAFEEREAAETCSAGAGSLTLEFTVLTRLLREYLKANPSVKRTATELYGIYAKNMWHDVDVFERVSQKAFWAVWDRRSELDLVGGGIDAWTGSWDPSGGVLSSIGASTDSFFEYALKTYILLSSSPAEPSTLNPTPLNPLSYFNVFHISVEAINRHCLVEHPTAYYQGVHMSTGSPMGGWVDSLSAFWPGLLALAGDIEGAEKAVLFYTALWQRFHALPERYSPLSYSTPLAYWPGRPEIIESVYHIYRATKDVFYLRVGEMFLKDIQARCWGRCGWTGLDDVRTGKRSNRQETFVLSETLAYLYLLFDDENPLHKGDAPWIFTTEGHPLRMPLERPRPIAKHNSNNKNDIDEMDLAFQMCQNPHVSSAYRSKTPAFYSATASRDDIFHAFHLLHLDLLPEFVGSTLKDAKLNTNNKNNEVPLNAGRLVPADYYPTIDDEQNTFTYNDMYSPTNSTFYPWTLPREAVRPGSNCSIPPGLDGFELLFPAPRAGEGGTTAPKPPAVQKIVNGLLVSNLAGVRLSFQRETAGGAVHKGELRVRKVAGHSLGKDDYVVLDKKLLEGMSAGEGMEFKFKKEEGSVDIIFDFGVEQSLGQKVLSKLSSGGSRKRIVRRTLQAITPSGIGAQDPENLIAEFEQRSAGKKTAVTSPMLPLRTIYKTGLTCTPLPAEAMKYEVILMKRGECSFATKLNNIPTSATIKLAIVVSYDSENAMFPRYGAKYHESAGLNDWYAFADPWLIRPLVDQYQVSRHGQKRKEPIPLLLVGGGEPTYNAIAEAIGIGIRPRWKAELGEAKINNLVAITW